MVVERNQSDRADLAAQSSQFLDGRSSTIVVHGALTRPHAPSSRRAGMRALVEGEKGEQQRAAIGYKRWWVGSVLSNQPIAGLVP